MFELGDGLLGTYGVESILQQPDIKAALTAVVLSANDPVAAWGGVKLLRERFAIEPCAVTGPATDNQVGVQIIREQMESRPSTRSAIPPSSATISSRGSACSNVGEAEGGRRDERARTPAIVLGGTGYVAGELLRLIAGHPRLELAGDLVRQPAGTRRSRAAFPHLRSAYPELAFAALDEIEALIAAHAAVARCSRPRRTASPPAIIDRLLAAAEAGGVRTHCVDISADFRYPSAGGLRGGLQARAWRARAHRAVHLRGAGTSAALADAACGASRAASRPRRCSPRVPLLALGLTEPRAVRRRHHRQHRLGPQARRGHAPSAAARGSVLLRRARPPACAGDRRLRATRPPASRPRSISCPIRVRSRAASTSRCRPRCSEPLTSAAGARRARASSTRLPVRARAGTAPRVKDVAASNYAHLSAVTNGTTIAVMCGARQSEQGRRRRRRCNG